MHLHRGGSAATCSTFPRPSRARRGRPGSRKTWTGSWQEKAWRMSDGGAPHAKSECRGDRYVGLARPLFGIVDNQTLGYAYGWALIDAYGQLDAIVNTTASGGHIDQWQIPNSNIEDHLAWTFHSG